MGHEHSEEGGCCGHDENFMDDMPIDIRRRVHALEHLHSKRASVAAEFRNELLALERKFELKYAPFNEERAKIVSGQREPTAEELATFSESGVEEVVEDGKKAAAAEGGIPAFWLTVLESHPTVASLINENDIEALSTLEDIRTMHLKDNAGFKLEFVFGPNEFFSNTILTKEYFLAEPEEGMQSEFVYDHAKGSEIAWKAEKNLCSKTVVRTQRHRSNNTTRTVKREEKLESFFHFFNPPAIPEEDGEQSDEEDFEELESRLQADYEVGEILKETIIPDAINWFTGKALEYADFDGDDDEEFDDEEGDSEGEADSDEGSDDEDSDDEPAVSQMNRGRRPAAGSAGGALNGKGISHGEAQEKPDCKQQ